MPVRGRGMAPLLRSGDELRLERCATDGLAPGDIALSRRADGVLVAHLVRSTRPLSTAAFLGGVNGPGLTLEGRASAVRRGGRELPVPRSGRLLLWLAHLAASSAYGSPLARRAARKARDFATSRWTLPLRRRRLGEVEARRLGPDDLPALLLFAGDRLSLPAGFVRRQLPGRWRSPGAAAGAFDRRGRMVGFAFLDEYRQEGVDLDGFWIRHLHTAPLARNMGVAKQLVGVLCAAAVEQGIDRVLADVRADNGPSLSVLRAMGFALTDSRAIAPGFVVLERRTRGRTGVA